MKALIRDLIKFDAGLATWSAATIAETLTGLGIETVVVSDGVLDCSITPNRGDAMSALGLARELHAWRTRKNRTVTAAVVANDTKLIDALPTANAPQIAHTIPGLVPTYEAVVFESVAVGPSPSWLADAVRELGWRSINNVVDLTNYLMDQYGQPLHAFDLDAILGDKITLRQATVGETLTTLDGVERTLPIDAIVMNDRDSLIDLVGIMGGHVAEITPKTTRVLLQAVVCLPERIRATTNALEHRTQAAIRYERGVDPSIARPVLSEAIRHLRHVEFGRARAVGQISLSESAPGTKPIVYQPRATNDLLGMTVPVATQARYLEQLGCGVVKQTAGRWLISPPVWRFDLAIWQDCAEEVARLVGLNDSLKAKSLRRINGGTYERSTIEWAEGLKDRLVELGLSEVLTYPFIHKSHLDALDLPMVGELANPINPARRYLRPSLAPTLLEVAASNPEFDPITVFEIGHVFTRTSEEERLGICLVGNTASADEWLVRLADAIGIDSAALTAVVHRIDVTPEARASFKLRKAKVTILEFRIRDLADARSIPANYRLMFERIRYRSVSKFPPVSRDLAVVVPIDVNGETIEALARTVSPAIESAAIFDEFTSDRFGMGKKSIALHIRYADPSRTLTDAEADELHELVTAAIETTFAAVRR